ncbi:MAG: LysR family transcriptional regulator [Alphaproteobacteria bacterium]|nr:MAG: LysR family transcriptional regulator [Alphaproteobacteria bacterium]
MDLQAIKTFCRAIETGNLTAAARGLHITKSVASRRIQALEDELGARLLARNTKGVTATDAGAAFYERCLRILDDLEDARQSVKCASDNLVGTLRFTAPRSFTDKRLGRPLTEFMKRHPDLAMDMNLTDEKVDIIGGGYDLGLRITSQLDDTSLIARKVTSIHSHLIASPQYLAERGTPRAPEDLKGHSCILYSNLPSNNQWRFLMGGETVSVRVDGAISTNSGDMQLDAARAGLGIAALPRFYLHEAVQKGEVVTVLEDFSRADVHLYALYPEKRLLPLKVRAFVDFLVEWFQIPGNSDCL